MKRIAKGFILPSAAITIKRSAVKNYLFTDKPPEIGDVVYGEIIRLGHHSSLEHTSGRIHRVQDGTRAVFVFGHRYAPDYYEGAVPEVIMKDVDLLSQSGIIGVVKTKNALIKDPTLVRIHGYVVDEDKKVVNSRNSPIIRISRKKKKFPRAKMILVCGTSMNSGKSMAATACCWTLSATGHNVRAAKLTGTASLKDILHMNDTGAAYFADFSYLGFPSTYQLTEEELLSIFDSIDNKYANNPKNFWVVELADGIIQRETSMLLREPSFTSRIHKLVFCAADAFGAIGGLGVLREQFGLVPDAISGLCSSSPLFLRELQEFSDIPVFNSVNINKGLISGILTGKS
jgi:hypothetical protein